MMNLKMKFGGTLNNEKGFSFTELLVAGSVAVILIALSVMVYVNQEKTLTRENQRAKIRAKGRLAIKLLTQELRMAGFGMPPGQGIVNISTPGSITILSNLEDVKTTVPPGAPLSVPIVTGDTDVTVVDASGFSNGDNIVIRDPYTNSIEIKTVSGTPGSTLIPLNTAVTQNFIFGVFEQLITVNKYNSITLFQSGSEIFKTIDGVTVPLLNDLQLPPNGLVYDYFGVTDPALVNKIGVTVKLEDPKYANVFIEFKSEVNVRNMS